ncbi:hypothetical protein V6N11_072552 [Hibiscus sabdariffa]|uniref:Uncharacterized protein n=1 Tax=Hibiscus sabdariffa TaxID=183260 RepID=A0ABR2U3M4_9ROSI
MFRFVSMDTEFPGTIFKPSKEIIEQGDPAINYDYMKANVDALESGKDLQRCKTGQGEIYFRFLSKITANVDRTSIYYINRLRSLVLKAQQPKGF